MHGAVDSEEGELISLNGTNFAPPKLSYSVIACVSHLTLDSTCTETNYQTQKHPRANKHTIVVRISAHFLGYSSEPQGKICDGKHIKRSSVFVLLSRSALVMLSQHSFSCSRLGAPLFMYNESLKHPLSQLNLTFGPSANYEATSPTSCVNNHLEDAGC